MASKKSTAETKRKPLELDTATDDKVQLRVSLDEHSKRLVKRLGSHWRLSGVNVINRVIEKYSRSGSASQLLVKFIRDTMPEREGHSLMDGSGVLFVISRSRRLQLNELAWDKRWEISGNRSKMLRILIYHAAEEEGIPMPKISRQEFEAHVQKKEVAKAERRKRAV